MFLIITPELIDYYFFGGLFVLACVLLLVPFLFVIIQTLRFISDLKQQKRSFIENE